MAPLKYKTPDAGENSDEQETFLFFSYPSVCVKDQAMRFASLTQPRGMKQRLPLVNKRSPASELAGALLTKLERNK